MTANVAPLRRRIDALRAMSHARCNAASGMAQMNTHAYLFPLDPRHEATRVLDYCRRDLNLPSGMRLEWHFLDGAWGEVLPRQPKVIRLSRKLLLEPWRVPDTVSHECMHARRILDGNLIYDAAAEYAASCYGRKVAALWSQL